MNLGTKSLLFGNHQFILHPMFVTWGWIKYHGRWPAWKEFICIVIHDWGYWGKLNMDGEEGQEHPKWATYFAARYVDNERELTSPLFQKYAKLCLYHSNKLAKQDKRRMSNLG